MDLLLRRPGNEIPGLAGRLVGWLAGNIRRSIDWLTFGSLPKAGGRRSGDRSRPIGHHGSERAMIRQLEEERSGNSVLSHFER